MGHLVAGRVEGGVAVPALHLDTDTLAQQVAHHLLQGQVQNVFLGCELLPYFQSTESVKD